MKVSIVMFVSAIVIFDCFHEIFSFLNPFFLIGRARTLSSIEMIENNGYRAETHTVETRDGYQLQMHRVLRKGILAPFKLANRRKPPVFLQHGLLGSSKEFLILGPEESLAFMLADLGFDVWLGNVRGNEYGRAHKTLSPGSNKFWNFSWHESGKYDIPAQIDYITYKTNQEKIYYIGYSLGTTVFFVMTSSLPQYNDKIEKAFLMAPLAFLKHTESPLRNLAPFAKAIKLSFDTFTSGSIVGHNKMTENLLQTLCFATLQQTFLCGNIMSLITGINFKKYDKRKLKFILKNYPSGYSAKALHHYIQLLQSGDFAEYDYGRMQNQKSYGSPTPPSYNLNDISVDLYFYMAESDKFSVKADVAHLFRELRSVKNVQMINGSDFNHLDFILGVKAKKLVYKNIIEELQSKKKPAWSFERSQNWFG